MARQILSLFLLAVTSTLAQDGPQDGAPSYTCPSQPAGTCSFRFTQFVFEESELEYNCAIHDHTGTQISLASGVCQSGLAMDSPLPWTVDIVASSYDGTPQFIADQDGEIWVEFRYAGGVYGKVSGGGNWEMVGEQELCVQFPCPGF